jgi:hypothetical protein
VKAKIYALGALILVAAWGCAASEPETTDDDGPAETEDQLILRKGSVDQAAIVESTTMQLASGPTDGHLDSYNQEDPFAIRSANYLSTYVERLRQFDGIDGKEDWKPEQLDAWTKRMSSANYLVVDTSKPCDWQSPHSYLEIERAQLTGQEHQTCGGRMPNEDAMDVTLNFLIRGPAASVKDEDALHDGVEQATKPSAPTFPYLAEMNGWL